jgi:dTDP-D-glucose 4,6-dehydratase
MAQLGWRPRWSFDEAVAKTVGWYLAYYQQGGAQAARTLTHAQLQAYAGIMASDKAECST